MKKFTVQKRHSLLIAAFVLFFSFFSNTSFAVASIFKGETYTGKHLYALSSKIEIYLNNNNRDIGGYFGRCCGAASTWGLSKLLQFQPKDPSKPNEPKDNYDWFKSTVDLIADWDGKRALTEEEAAEFERFFSLIEYFQNIYGDLEHASDGLVRGLKDPIIKEYSIASLFTLEQLKQLLKTENFIQDRKLILIKSHNHCTALFKDGISYYYFNSNDYSGEAQTISTDEVAKRIFESNSFDPLKPSPLAFNMFSLNKIHTEYPSQQSILNDMNPPLDQEKGYATETSGLSLASSNGSVASLLYFLEKRESNEQRARDAYIALTTSAQVGQLEIIEAILENSEINPNNVVNWEGKTAFMVAASGGYYRCIKGLLTNPKIDPNKADKKGWTPLMIVAHYGHLECVKALLTSPRVDLNKINNDGLTALMLAQDNGHIECAEALIEKGAKPSRRGWFGWTI